MKKICIGLCATLLLLSCLEFMGGSEKGSTGGSRKGCNFSSEEQAFMDILQRDSRQRRASIACHPSILRVARDRARDMAARRYFSHTNPDGIGPNHLVRQTGYKLPEWWGTQRDGNYIESISAGRATAQETYTSWLNSAGHKTHVLGEKDFYAGQTVVAIGHHYDPSSQYKHYWVFLSVPPEP